MVTGFGSAVSQVAVPHRDLAGIHFTGSTPVFQQLWRAVGDNLPSYRSYPRMVGETGGKDFVIAHPSADVDVLRTALVRGAFEYQGQKCSAASRAYVPRSVWRQLEGSLLAEVEALPMGDVSDFSNFMGAVIDASLIRTPARRRSNARVLPPASRSSRAARPTTAKAGSSGPQSCWARILPMRSSCASTSARCLPCTSSTTTATPKWLRRPPTSRRTP